MMAGGAVVVVTLAIYVLDTRRTQSRASRGPVQ
jgi:hypothetical protein